LSDYFSKREKKKNYNIQYHKTQFSLVSVSVVIDFVLILISKKYLEIKIAGKRRKKKKKTQFKIEK
jgi:hypothetical protein